MDIRIKNQALPCNMAAGCDGNVVWPATCNWNTQKRFWDSHRAMAQNDNLYTSPENALKSMECVGMLLVVKARRAKAWEGWQGAPLPQCCSGAHMLLIIRTDMAHGLPLKNMHNTCTCSENIHTCLPPSFLIYIYISKWGADWHPCVCAYYCMCQFTCGV